MFSIWKSKSSLRKRYPYLVFIYKSSGERSAVHPPFPKQAALCQLDAHLRDV